MQRSELAVKLKPLYAAKTKENQIVRKGQQPGTTLSPMTKLKPRHTLPELAKIAGVSWDTSHRAERIVTRGTEKPQEEARVGSSQWPAFPMKRSGNTGKKKPLIPSLRGL
jgi:hypothetical protein